MQMSKTNGEKLGIAIKNDEQLRQTALVMLSTIGQKGDAQRLKKNGFSAYLVRPIKKSLLFDCLRTVVGSTPPNVEKETDNLITRFSIQEQKEVENLTTKKLKILLAEDNKMNQKVATKMLEKMGHTVTIAENGLKAVDHFKSGVFDIILMDGNMPEMDGIEATIKIRELEADKEKKIPIVALTANAMKGDRERYIESGMNEFITKPFKKSSLLEVLKTLSN
jgi:CheY-like chemotaxis protein